LKKNDDLGRGGQGPRAPGSLLKPKLRICVPVVEPTVNRARGRYQRAARKGLWTEIRLDFLEEPAPDLQKLFRSLPGPVIATNRLTAEGGRWRGEEPDRLARLTQALDLGVTCLDVELATDAFFRRELAARREKTKLILSWHDLTGTPEVARLEAVLDEMLASEVDVVKLVAMANDPADNLRMLSLIPRAQAQGKDVIAFCMGPLGKWSRIAAPLVGSWLTFAPFSKQGASAPGQLTVNDVKRVWNNLKP
jgi:3-dehydroquinate dehydratase type I